MKATSRSLPYSSQSELFAMLRRRHNLVYYALHRPSITESPEYRHWSATQSETYDYDQTIYARSRRTERNRRLFFSTFLALVVAINLAMLAAFLMG